MTWPKNKKNMAGLDLRITTKMKITTHQLRRIIKEAQWGNFTGGAAPLDMPARDSGPIPKDQLRKLADIFINDMGMSPEEVLLKKVFIDAGVTDLAQLKEGTMKISKRQLRRIIREEKTKILREQAGPDLSGIQAQGFKLVADVQSIVDSGDSAIMDMADKLRAMGYRDAEYTSVMGMRYVEVVFSGQKYVIISKNSVEPDSFTQIVGPYAIGAMS
jgi:hypothetical protein